MEEIEEIRSKLIILGFTVVDATWGQIGGFGGVPALYFKGDEAKKTELLALVAECYESYPESNEKAVLKISDIEKEHYTGFVLFAGPVHSFGELEDDNVMLEMNANDLIAYRRQFSNFGKFLRTRLDSSAVASELDANI